MKRPLKLVKNRVWRVYTGGALLDRFQGIEAGEDGFFPEEWVGSTTLALNEGRDLPDEGLSRCLPDADASESVLLSDLIQRHPEAMLGSVHVEAFGADTGYLVKLLDSAVRLPIQAHPDRSFSEKYFNSPYGKTETWTILDSRTVDGVEPYVLFGFKKGVTEQQFRNLYECQDVEGMIECLNRVNVKKGDVFVIPGRVPHAIGSGVFLIEIQEPTDFVFQLDKKGPCWNLSPFQVHMGLGDDVMFKSFDFSERDILKTHHGFYDFSDETQGVTSFLPLDLSEFFGAARVFVSDRLEKENHGFTIGVCTRGQGACEAGGTKIHLKQGETFCLPACVDTVIYTSETRGFEIIETYPPKSG